MAVATRRCSTSTVTKNGGRDLFRYEAGALAEHRMNADDRALPARSDVMITTVFNGVVEYFESVICTSCHYRMATSSTTRLSRVCTDPVNNAQ